MNLRMMKPAKSQEVVDGVIAATTTRLYMVGVVWWRLIAHSTKSCAHLI